ncbi:bile acid:sodium symporter [Chryseobacterium manosquense]|uniref:Bile acid:sodium symporter n=1 Tax=Chryseobacterium manosquense TaxID=2754694 RepID=A0A7H1DX35_9FLAO|nr:bile acid:sodium symporter family protein [Chryseobacterium manosquense]AZB21974.1 bile acid:sodium symporter [Kaistella haifensis]QNS41543.1 bile acid:sodium symporter [Chryseobacterium manosquense]ROI07553.1 bile acid:sodium symporter [Kaistella haifensis]
MFKIFNKQNTFLLFLVAMVLLAKIVPFRPAYNQWFPLSDFIEWGIAGIFLLYGLKLNLKEVVKDVSNWKLHLLIQSATFLLFPFLVLIFYPAFRETAYYGIWLSVFFLASLPSTVSSSVVMVSIAKGNVMSAIFNASISGLIGIVMTPLLMSFFLNANTANADKTEIVEQLLLKVLLPIIIGIALNPFFKKWITRYSSVISEFDRLIILLIVYESFSTAFIEKIFATVPGFVFLILTISVVSLFFIVYNIIKFIAKKMGFQLKEIITATFCGSKKSLVHGSLFLLVLGIPDDQKVLFLLPVMMYHSFQLFYVSWLANKIAQRNPQ